MNKLIFKTLIALLITVSTAYAQRPGGGRDRTPPTPEERTERTIERIDAQLELSDEQKAAFEAEYLAFFQEMDSKRNENREEMKEEREELAQKRDEELKSVLSPEQLERYEILIDIQKTRMEERKENRQRGRRGNY
ncbi:MAG: hypothetical protein AAF363_19945 [Bacteroidota bacterium]